MEVRWWVMRESPPSLDETMRGSQLSGSFVLHCSSCMSSILHASIHVPSRAWGPVLMSVAGGVDEAFRNSSLIFEDITISCCVGSELSSSAVIHSVLNRGLSPSARISIC